MRAIDIWFYQLSNNNIRALSPKKGIKYFEQEVPKFWEYVEISISTYSTLQYWLEFAILIKVLFTCIVC